jgi:sulfur relay (sulfurtransferase) DsrF/TusC family protein
MQTIDLDFRFAIVSDLHIAVSETISADPRRFHWVEIGILALESVFDRLSTLKLDFLLIPGDLTQDGEILNHQWMQQRLAQLPFPCYVIPGNHDIPLLDATPGKIGRADFPSYYRDCGYGEGSACYYQREILPGVQLIGLNSQQFDDGGTQTRGYIDRVQLDWLDGVLAATQDLFTLVMVHHNVLEHIPNQSTHNIGQRYILSNSSELIEILDRYGVKYIFTGHLHVQDIARSDRIYDITTGSLISYPHPYRLCHYHQDADRCWLQIESEYIRSLPGWPELQTTSRNLVRDRSNLYLLKMLVEPPLNLHPLTARRLMPQLREFWADVAAGDTLFEFNDLPPIARQYFESFGAITDGIPTSIDNHVAIIK